MSTAPMTGSVPAIPRGSRASGDWTVAGAITFTVLVVTGAYAIGFAMAYGVVGLRHGFSSLFDPEFPLWRRGAAAVRFSAAVLLTVEVLQLGLALILAGWAGRNRIAALQLAWPRLPVAHWIGLLALLFVVKAVATVLSAGFSPSTVQQDLKPFEELFREPLTRALFLATVVLAGLTEELIFRGVLSRTLEGTRLGFWGGALVANLAFATIHLQYGLGGQFVVLAIGMTLSWMRARTGSIWPGAVCHAANNAVAFLAMRAMV